MNIPTLNIRQNTSFSFYCLLFVLSIISAGCGRHQKKVHSGLLDAVPAEAQTIIVADLYECAAHIGLRIASEGIVSDDGKNADLEALPRNISGPIALLAQYRHSVDLSHVAIFSDSASQSVIFTAMRIAGTELNDLPDDPQVALFSDDSRVWVAAKPFDAASLDSIKAHASVLAIADCRSDCEFFSDYQPVRARVSVPEFRNEAGDDFSFVYASSRVDENNITVRLSFTDSLGSKADPFSRLSPIDENVYSYLPTATLATVAIGADRNTFRSILSNYGGFIPLRQRMAAELSSGFLCDSAATLAVGFAPGGSAETISDFSLDTWVFTSLLPIDIDRTEDFIDIIDKITRGALLCDIAGPYLAVSNSSLEMVASGDDYGTTPSESKIRLQAVVPYRSELMKALKLEQGMSLDIDASHAEVTIRFSALGGDGAPGESFAPVFTKNSLKKKIFGK